MVSTAWILLISLGCRAEDLGIELLPTGLDAISQEDLKRDYYLRMKASSNAEIRSWMHKRMQDMGLETEESKSQICGTAGKQGKMVRANSNVSDSVPSMLACASLISLAKAFDKSPRRRKFCFLMDERSVEGMRIGDLRGKGIVFSDGKRHVYTEHLPEFADEINYQHVANHVRAIATALME